MADYNLGTARGVIEIEYKGDGAKKAQESLKQSGQQADKSSVTMNKVGRASAIAGAAIAAGFGVAVKSAADFEQQISNIGAVSGANGKQMEQLRQKALQLGKDTQYSASESAQAMEELVKAGISIPDVLNGAADATVNLAAAGGVDMPTAANIASNAMNQFGLSAKDMTGVVDNIAGAANASAIDVGDFGYSLGQVGAVAHLAGVNFKDTATAIALMGNAGIKGSDAGTSLKSMFQRLQPQTEKQFSTMTDLGLITANLGDANKFLQKEGLGTAKSMGEATSKFEKLAASMGKGTVGTVKNANAAQQLMLKYGGLRNAFYDAEGNTKSLAQVSGVLQKSLKGMTKEQKQAALTTLFGSDAIRAAAVLANSGSKGFDKMARSMNKVSAADVAAKRMDNFKGSLEQMKGSLETAGITIGTLLLPALRKLVDGVTGALNGFLQLSPGVQATFAILAGGVGVLLLLLAAFVKIVNFAKQVRLAFLAVKVAAAETWIAALGPIALVIAAIAAVIVIVILLWKHSETFRKIVTGAWNAVKSAAVAVANWFKGLPGMFAAVWSSIVNGVKTFIGGAISWLKSNWMLLLPIFFGPLGLVVALVIKFWAQIKAFFAAGVRVIMSVLRGGLNVLMAIWRGFWGVFGGVIKAAFGLIVALVRLEWTIIRGIFLLALRGIQVAARAAWNVITKIFRAGWQAVVVAFRWAWNLIRPIVVGGINAIRNVIRAGMNVIRSISSSVWRAISGVVRSVWGTISGIVSGAVGRVRGVVSGAWNAVRNLTSSAWHAVTNVVSGAVRSLGNIVGTIRGKVTGALSGAGQWLYNAGKEIIQGLINGIQSMIEKVTNTINSITDKVARFLPGSPVREGPLMVLNNGYAGRQIVKMVAGGVQDMKEPLRRTVETVMQVPALSSDLGRVGAASKTTLDVAGAAPRRFGGGSGSSPSSSSSRLVHGKLSIDRSGRAWISGVAQDVYDGNESFDDTYSRMGGL